MASPVRRRGLGVRAIYAPGPPLTGVWDEENWPRKRLVHLADRLGSDGLGTLGVMTQFDPSVFALARELGIPIVTEVNTPEMGEVIRRLHAEGLLGPDNIFNHITGIPHDALEILREAGVGVNVCPRSDAQYGIGDGGMGALQAALDAGLKPALCVDNETSYGGDMFGEMRTAFFLQRAMTQRDRFAGKPEVPPPVTVRQMLEAATLNGARCAGLADRTGSLTPGKDADLIAFRARDLNLHPLSNAVGAVVQAADRSNIDTVMVARRIRKAGGSVVGLDEGRLRAHDPVPRPPAGQRRLPPRPLLRRAPRASPAHAKPEPLGGVHEAPDAEVRSRPASRPLTASDTGPTSSPK
ncbi:MAG TPA: amidohydrolase family protein [Phenylobacterium sp.]